MERSAKQLNDAHGILRPQVCDQSRFNLRLPISFLLCVSRSKRRSPTFLGPMLHSFGVHLSTWLTVGKERARMSHVQDGAAHGHA